jgi:hypothetical protein
MSLLLRLSAEARDPFLGVCDLFHLATDTLTTSQFPIQFLCRKRHVLRECTQRWLQASCQQCWIKCVCHYLATPVPKTWHLSKEELWQSAIYFPKFNLFHDLSEQMAARHICARFRNLFRNRFGQCGLHSAKQKASLFMTTKVDVAAIFKCRRVDGPFANASEVRNKYCGVAVISNGTRAPAKVSISTCRILIIKSFTGREYMFSKMFSRSFECGGWMYVLRERANLPPSICCS